MNRLLPMMACWVLAGCAQSDIVMQLYDGGADNKAILIGEIESFASENAVEVQRPDVTPAASYAEVTVVHGSDWETASLAWALADRLSSLGVAVIVRPTRIQNHVVTGRHIGVFVGQTEAATQDDAEDLAGQISQLGSAIRRMATRQSS